MTEARPGASQRPLADPQTSQVAKRAFFRIMGLWQVSPEQARTLLGSPARSTFFNWKNGTGAALPRDTLERVSYVLGIYKGLQVLFPDPAQADAWPKKPNAAFAGQSALERMLAGNVTDLDAVRRYVDFARGEGA